MIKIGDLAQQTGLTPSKIRFYEAQGLIGPVDRGMNGYRQYPDHARQVLELISLAQQAGFSLAEIRVLVREQGKVHGGHEGVIAQLRKKLAELESLQDKLAESCAGIKRVIERIENAPVGDCAKNAEAVLKDFRSTEPK